MKRIIPVIVLALGAVCTVRAQEETSGTAKSLIPVVRLADDIQVKFGGFIRAEYYIDSRETVGAVDDLFGFFPEPKRPDANGNDLNDVVRHNISTQATRFNALLNGPALGDARSTAFFEFDFTGGNTVNARLRHAWVKLSWPKTELLLGKTWNPLAEMPFPSVAGLHTGIPFRPFGRGEQLRFTYRPAARIAILAAAFYQTEHKSTLESSAGGDIRANPIPDFHVQFHYRTSDFSVGVLSEYKIIRPATQTTGTGGTFRTRETLASYALGTYADYRVGLFNAKGGFTYGENLSELFQQGGYAVRTQDEVTGARTYTASRSAAGWVNLTYGRRWIAGVFAGYQKNLGFGDPLLAGGSFFGRWQDVDHIYRIAPSIKFAHRQWTFHAELDYNVAAYGQVDYADNGRVRNAEDISGVRGIFATTFYF